MYKGSCYVVRREITKEVPEIISAHDSVRLSSYVANGPF